MENPGPEQLKNLPKVTILNSLAALLTAVLSISQCVAGSGYSGEPGGCGPFLLMVEGGGR